MDFVSGQIELVYNVRWTVGDDEVILASAARANLTLSDERRAELDSAISGAVEDLASSLGLLDETEDPDDKSLGFGDGLDTDLDNQEL